MSGELLATIDRLNKELTDERTRYAGIINGLEDRLDTLKSAVQNYLDAGADPSDDIRWALHHALNDPDVEKLEKNS